MATLIKKRARTLLATGKLGIYYSSMNMPMLDTREHAAIELGDYIIRVATPDIPDMIAKLQAIHDDPDNWIELYNKSKVKS